WFSQKKPWQKEIELMLHNGFILFRNVADVLADERFDLELEAIVEHQFDFLLPRLLLGEPRILRNLARPFDVLFVQPDLYARTELASRVILAAQAQKTGFGNCHAA